MRDVDQAARTVFAKVSDDMKDWWREALYLRSGMNAWQAISSSLVKYPNAYSVVRGWYSDSTLAGCRRLVDNSGTARSLLRTLRKLRTIAPQVTVDVIIDSWRARDPLQYTDADDDWLRHTAQQALGWVVHREEGEFLTELTRRAVERDIDLLQSLDRDVVELANQRVAHRSATPTEGLTVTQEQVTAFLHTIVDVTARWASLLNNVHLHDSPPRIPDFAPVAKALELFDWQDYQEARADAVIEQLGASASDEAYAAFQCRLQVVYRWHKP